VSYSICNVCGGYEDYNSETKEWFCPKCLMSPEEAAIADVPRKYSKLVKSGRWEYITKGYIPVGVRRKSTGQERWF
jgi:hypothetical protein